MLILQGDHACAGFAEESRELLLFLLVVLKAFLVLRPIAALNLLQALDVVSQADVYSLLLRELEFELLDAMFHDAVLAVVM